MFSDIFMICSISWGLFLSAVHAPDWLVDMLLEVPYV